MSTVEILNLKCNYIKMGDHGRDVILMHGWGQNVEMMKYIQDYLKDHFVVYNIDFPGFGNSELPNEPWSTIDYTNWFKEFVKVMGIENPILIGHSFGCRIALRYASSNNVYKMVLTGAAGLKPKRTLDYYIKVYSYKVMKQVFKLPFLSKYKNKIQGNFGSDDYKNSNGILRATFVKVVNEDIEPVLSSIKAETLLVYGELDEATPLWMGKKLEQLMPNAALAIFEKADHFAYYYQYNRFNLVLDAFLKGDYNE